MVDVLGAGGVLAVGQPTSVGRQCCELGAVDEGRELWHSCQAQGAAALSEPPGAGDRDTLCRSPKAGRWAVVHSQTPLLSQASSVGISLHRRAVSVG